MWQQLNVSSPVQRFRLNLQHFYRHPQAHTSAPIHLCSLSAKLQWAALPHFRGKAVRLNTLQTSRHPNSGSKHIPGAGEEWVLCLYTHSSFPFLYLLTAEQHCGSKIRAQFHIVQVSSITWIHLGSFSAEEYNPNSHTVTPETAEVVEEPALFHVLLPVFATPTEPGFFRTGYIFCFPIPAESTLTSTAVRDHYCFSYCIQICPSKTQPCLLRADLNMI